MFREKTTGREIVELNFSDFKKRQYCDRCDYAAIYIVKDYKKDDNYSDENRYAILKTCGQHVEMTRSIIKNFK